MVLILDGNAEIGAHVDEHYVFLDLFKVFEYKYHNIARARIKDVIILIY